MACPSAARPAPGLTPAYLVLHVLLPIWIGGWIYVLWRADHLFMFAWFDALGLTSSVHAARAAAAPWQDLLPHWVLFSVPDGAWVYAAVAFFARLWHDGPRWAQVLWTSLAPAMAIGGELGQIPGWVPGTWDVMDMVCYVAAGGVALAFALAPWRTTPARTAEA